jgi:hypothetical protein
MVIWFQRGSQGAEQTVLEETHTIRLLKLNNKQEDAYPKSHAAWASANVG